jgi:hypothetical protein
MSPQVAEHSHVEAGGALQVEFKLAGGWSETNRYRFWRAHCGFCSGLGADSSSKSITTLESMISRRNVGNRLTFSSYDAYARWRLQLAFKAHLLRIHGCHLT